MADWGILRNTSNDYLSALSPYNNHGNVDTNLSQYHMMSSFIDRTFPTQSSLYDENTFCTADNVDQCISHVNAELSGLGLKPVSRDGNSRITSLINALNDLVRLYQRSGRVKEELENRLHRSNSDITDNQSVIRRLKSDKDRLERDVASEKEKHRQTHNKIKGLTSKLKAEKDELKRLQSQVKDRDGQYKHELKKKQREINKLMERLHQLLMDKNPDRRIGMDMVGLLHRGDSKRSTWKTANNSNKQEEMYQMLISNYEGKQQELRVENSDLRDCLMDMQRELSTLLGNTDNTLSDIQAKNGGLSTSSSDSDLSFSSCQDFNDDYFQMPYDMLRENLQKSFHDTCKKIKENVRKCSTHNHSTSKGQSRPSKSTSNHKDESRESERRTEEMDKLKRQIEKYKDIMKQQEELIQQSLQTQSKSFENSFLQESQILQEKESLSEQRRKLYQDKANFEEERRKCTEIALQVQQERIQIEEEKNNLLKSQFLQMSPYQGKPPTPPRSLGATGERTRLLPCTPVFSPAPGKGKAASTAELYNMLSVKRKQSPLKDPVSLLKQSSLSMCTSTDSLNSSCPSAHSAPCDLRQHSTTSLVSSAKRLSFEDLEEIEKKLYFRHAERRESSTGSQSSLDGQ